MIEGFDKEIDSLLRRAAKGESVQTFAAHMDADEISLFAENALTSKARVRAVEHLAECAKCRKILSNLIPFNAEIESETIHARESNIIPVVAPAIPWYRRLFAFPQITFAMGALVLVFAGIIAVMVRQTANDSQQNVSVAQREEIRETSRGTGGASGDGETRTVETYSGNMSNSASVNPGVMSNSNTTTTTTAVSNTTANVSANLADKTVLPAPRQAMPPEPVKNEQQKPLTLNGETSNTAALNKTTDMVAGAPAPKDSKQQQRADEETKEISERNRAAERDALNDSQKSRLGTQSAPSSLAKKRASEDKNKTGEARLVGGKTFRQVNNVWTDSAYTSQPPVMIRRGSDDYKRLDSGLRSIAESLGGTVVVVWKSRAYRIHN
ncbi:MAG TPA: zf-HC2 domain-containing protein [Pyrinomonadaceae bacterium]|jgi:hypothetical protein